MGEAITLNSESVQAQVLTGKISTDNKAPLPATNARRNRSV